MNALNKSTFKQWQRLPLLCHPLQEEAETNRLPKFRAADSAGPSCVKPVRGECRPRRMESDEAVGNRSQAIPAIRASQRP